MERKSVILILFIAVGTLLTGVVVDGCSMPDGWRPLSVVEKILDATDVLYGQIRKVYPDMRFDYGAGTTAYTAEMEVFCVLKGQPINPVVNLTEAGIIPGLCHSTNLTVGGRYIVIVQRDDQTGELTPRTVQIDATAPGALENVTSACDLQPVYPKGVEASTATVACPTPIPQGRCKSKRDFERAAAGSGDAVKETSDGSSPATGESRSSSTAITVMKTTSATFSTVVTLTMTSIALQLASS